MIPRLVQSEHHRSVQPQDRGAESWKHLSLPPSPWSPSLQWDMHPRPFPVWRDFVALVRRCVALIPLCVCLACVEFLGVLFFFFFWLLLFAVFLQNSNPFPPPPIHFPLPQYTSSHSFSDQLQVLLQNSRITRERRLIFSGRSQA